MNLLTLKQVKPYDFRSLILYLFIRFKVYIGEFQRGITEEFSIKDIKAEHYIFLKGKEVIGIARIVYSEDIAELGRIAVIKESRNRGCGASLVNQLICNIKINNRANMISLVAADRSLIKFYKQFGFIENGEVYFNDIPYVNMVKPFEERY